MVFEDSEVGHKRKTSCDDKDKKNHKLRKKKKSNQDLSINEESNHCEMVRNVSKPENDTVSCTLEQRSGIFDEKKIMATNRSISLMILVVLIKHLIY